MVCYATLREETLQRLRLKLPPLTDDEIRELLSVETHAEVHAAIEKLTESELLAVVTEAIRRMTKRKGLKGEVFVYA